MNSRKPIPLIGGFIIGLAVCLLMILEGRLLADCIVPEERAGWAKALFGIFVCLAVFFFIMIFKYFASRSREKLMVHNLLSVVIAAAATYLVSVVGCLCIAKWVEAHPQIQELMRSGFFSDGPGFFLVSNALGMLLVLLAAVFFMVFAWLVKGKIKYILYISDQVKHIENEGFGQTLDVVGNDELSDLCRSINHMSLELQRQEMQEKQAEKKKNELMTNVSHDLRSPLTSIIGYVDLLKKDGFQNQKACSEYLDVIDRRLQGLHGLINELFELTKLNETDGALHLQYADLAAPLRHLAMENAVLLGQKGLNLQWRVQKEPFFMEFDSEKFPRAMQNLFDNVMKYAKEHTDVWFRAERRGDVFCIQLENTVQEDADIQIDAIFDRFYKEDLSRSDTQSSGLGLAIVKRIIELHGGSVAASLDGARIGFVIEFQAGQAAGK